jgi:hypothetical protein
MEQSPSSEVNMSASQESLSAFYGTRRFITAFTRSRYLPLLWATSMKSMPSHFTSSLSVWILYLVYAYIFQVVSFPQVSPPKPYKHRPFLSLIKCHKPHSLNFSQFYHTNNIWWGVKTDRAPHYVVFTPPLLPHRFRHKYLPQHPILKHWARTPPSMCEWTSNGLKIVKIPWSKIPEELVAKHAHSIGGSLHFIGQTRLFGRGIPVLWR